MFSKEYGKSNASDMVAVLQKRIDDYNTSVGTCAVFSQPNPDDYVIVIQTPFMRRVCNEIKQSSEVLFVDSSGNVDRFNFKIFLLMINSYAGGLPIGVIICSSEKECIIKHSLELFSKYLFAEESFYGKGNPAVIITDDYAAERNAFSSHFPSSVLLCIFHVLQRRLAQYLECKFSNSA